MQFLVAFLVLATIVYADNVEQFSGYNPAYGYLKNIAIPEAERLRKAEEAGSRIIGGGPVPLGLYPFAAGILAEVITDAQVLSGVCGGALISNRRVLTAAHCWSDGRHQALRFIIILGSVNMFSGGTRVSTSTVALHPNYNPAFLGNDIAIAYFPSPVSISGIIAPVALPAFESLAGERAVAVDFGITDGSISSILFLNHVNVTIIPNSECSLVYPFIQSSNICTIGIEGLGLCNARSGTPFITNRNNRQILIGISTFSSALGCQSGFPHGSARVTSFMDFITQHL